jgi:hypothetical protein
MTRRMTIWRGPWLRIGTFGWRRSELAMRSRLAGGGTPADRTAVASTLARWRSDSDPAGLRDEAGIRATSEGEPKACRATWAEVEVHLMRVGGMTP